jgi:hypothetical protein
MCCGFFRSFIFFQVSQSMALPKTIAAALGGAALFGVWSMTPVRGFLVVGSDINSEFKTCKVGDVLIGMKDMKLKALIRFDVRPTHVECFGLPEYGLTREHRRYFRVEALTKVLVCCGHLESERIKVVEEIDNEAWRDFYRHPTSRMSSCLQSLKAEIQCFFGWNAASISLCRS